MTPLELALAKKGGTLAAGVIKDKIVSLVARGDAAMSRASVEIDAEILVEAAWRVKQLEGRVDQLEGLLLVHLDDPQLARVRRNFVLEAAREALDERYGMLVSAAAEALLVDRTPAEQARAERVLRELDPADVRELHRLAHVAASAELLKRVHDDQGRANDGFANGLARRDAWKASPSRDELEITGCIVIEGTTYGDLGPVYLTRRGELVLELLRGWL